MQVVVQPGMPYEMLNEELKGKGLFFPVDVGSPTLCSPGRGLLPCNNSLVPVQRSAVWSQQAVLARMVSIMVFIYSMLYAKVIYSCSLRDYAGKRPEFDSRPA